VNPDETSPNTEPRYPVLERATALVLVLVVLALGWIIGAAYVPGIIRLVSAELEVIVVLVLLSLALLLVSVVALLHTRSES
jgi:lipid-binding SYLF domain-containing protein